MSTKTLSVEIDEKLHRRLKAKTADQDTTMKAMVTEAVEEWVDTWGDRVVSYTVQAGDTLGQIAQRFYNDSSKYLVIAYFNDLDDPNVIEPGWELLIPEPVQVPEPEPLPSGESPFIFGFHDAGGQHIMAEEGRKGWVLVTEAIGHNPNDHGGQNYDFLADSGFGVIVRLNNGYNPSGTMPHSSHYADFSQRCANFVEASSGCHIWLIGNEMNLANERPGRGTPSEQEITPALYVDCFRRCRQSIKAVDGHDRDQLVIGAVAPWNNQTQYLGNPAGFWIKYFEDILAGLGDNLDGIALHTYTHQVEFHNGSHDNLISDETKPWPQWPGAHFNFRTYRDFMEAIPAALRHLPVYITETNQDREGDHTWFAQNLGWVQEANAEIDSWNSDPNHQKIRCLLLYRWKMDDAWGLADGGKPGVIEDFRQALQHDYRWR